MFEESLVESTGRIHTQSSRLAIGSLILQAAILFTLILIPYLYPATLPKQALSMLLTAPPPPPASPLEHITPSHATGAAVMASLTVPSRIPPHAAVSVGDDPAPPALGPGLENDGPAVPGAINQLFKTSTPVPLKILPAATTKTGPIHVSAGVAAGRLLTPIRPVYSAVAKAARIQGTVIVEATISRIGTVENAHAVSGPPMLIQAAIDAIAQARYQPYKLNGEPVEVQTTINVVFTLSE